MKKVLLITAVLITALAALAVAGYAYAQSQTPPTPQNPAGSGTYGPGMMRGRGGAGGMMGGYARTGEQGPLHTYMINAFAEALGIDAETLESRHDAGETMWDIAVSLNPDLTQEDFAVLMTDARTAALTAAVADGVITQEQADWMIQRSAQMHANGYGPGTGGCQGGSGMRGPRGGGMGGRWNAPAQPNQPTN